MFSKHYLCAHSAAQDAKIPMGWISTSQAYGLSYCPQGEDTAAVSSFVDDLTATTHVVGDTHLAMHEDMGSNLTYDLKGLRAKVSRKKVIFGRKKTPGASP